MRRTSLLIAAAALLTGACQTTITIDGDHVEGSGTVTTVEVDIGTEAFDRVALAGEGRVDIAIGEPASLTIAADDNIHEYLEAEVGDGTLVLSTREGVDIEPSDTIVYTVVAPGLSALDLSGSGVLAAPGVTAPGMEVTIEGSGEIRLDDLDATQFTATISGSGNVVASGSAQTTDLAVPGSGTISVGDLEAASATVDVSGSGSVQVWVRDELSVDISGSGSVAYYGSPHVEQSVSGSGTVTGLGDHP